MHKHELILFLQQQPFVTASNYIWLPKMEWLGETEASERKKIWSSSFNLQALELFAIDGYGDMYAWFKGNEFNEEVVFVDLESEYGGSFFAPNIPGAIFRRILEFAGGIYTEFCTDDEKNDEEDSEDYISESEAINMLKSYRSAFGNYFESEWNSTLSKMIVQGFNEQKCFINQEQVNQIIIRSLNFSKLEKPIALRK